MPEPLAIGIAVHGSSRLGGGVFDAARRSAQSLAAAGHHVEVFALEDAWTEEDRSAWAPLDPIITQTLGPHRLGFAPALGRALAGRRFDIIHQHGIWQAFSIPLAAFARRTGTPTIISPHGMLDPWAVRHAGWKKRLIGMLYENANLSRAACLQALNASEAASIRAYGLSNPVARVANGTDLPQAAPPPPPAWWPGGRVLLFVGRLHAKKGVVALVEAFARLRAEAPDIAAPWRLVIAGWDDGGRAELAAALARHGLQDRVMLPGPLYGADKAAALGAAEAFVLPSSSEGLPMSVLEAWGWSLPVLMSEACNLPDGFAAGAAVRIETDPAALAVALGKTFARAPAELAAIGARGRAHVAAHYTWPRIAAAQEAAYRWTIAGCPAARAPAPSRPAPASLEGAALPAQIGPA